MIYKNDKIATYELWKNVRKQKIVRMNENASRLWNRTIDGFFA